MALEPGDPAPSVRARNQHGETVTLDTDGPLVVYFYPRDDTPGCTLEAEQFHREYETYAEAGVEVVGVSTDDVKSHAAFSEHVGLTFDLLADPDGDLAAAFDLSVRRGATPRTTFVVLDGAILDTYPSVDPDGHAREVLAALLEAGVVDLEG